MHHRWTPPPQTGPLLYKGSQGPHAIAEADFTLHIAARNKDLPVHIVYPADGGPYPLIVFSHGFRGSGRGYGPLVDSWASWGYVIVQPTHPDSLDLMQRGERIGLRDNSVETGFGGWANRAKDVTYLLDHLDEVRRQVPLAHFDAHVIGMGGHSFGAGTSELIGGAKVRTGEDLADPRPQAILMISPQGIGALYDEHSWSQFTRPAMVISGTNDKTMSGQPAETRKDPYRLSTPGNKYLVWIEGAHHDFGGITGARWYPNAGPKNPTELQWVQMASLAFWDSTLKHDEKARDYLASSDLPAYSNGVVSLSRR